MTEYWRGDAETGDKSQWCKQTVKVDDRIRVVTTPVNQGQYSYRVELRKGDNPSGNRSTLATGPNCDGEHLIKNGDEAFYGFSVFIPATSFAIVNKWRLVLQFKAHDTGSPPISINVRGINWLLNYRPTSTSNVLTKWRKPFRKNVWEKFMFHIGWSTDPRVGFIEMYLNNILVVPKFNTATIHIQDGSPVDNFVALGLYRDSSIPSTDVIYHDGFVAGRSYEEVNQS